MQSGLMIAKRLPGWRLHALADETDELIGARWEEFNVPEALWTIPGSRMMLGEEHLVPVLEKLRALPR